MTGKEKITKYCKSVMTVNSSDHVCACEAILHMLMNNKPIREEPLCPSNYGLDDYIGLCKLEKEIDVKDWEKQEEQCNRCWDKALKL